MSGGGNPPGDPPWVGDCDCAPPAEFGSKVVLAGLERAPEMWSAIATLRSSSIGLSSRRLERLTSTERIEIPPRTRRELREEQARLPFWTRFLVDFRCLDESVPSPIRDLEWQSGGLSSSANSFVDWERRVFHEGMGSFARGVDLVAIRRMARAIASSDAPLNLTAVGRETGLRPTTAGRYLDLLESHFLLDRYSSYSAAPAPRRVRGARVRIFDSAWGHQLRSELANERDARIRREGRRDYVFQNLRALASLARPESRCYSWEIQGRHRVDLVIESGAGAVPVMMVDRREDIPAAVDQIEAFSRRCPDLHVGLIVHSGIERERLDDRLFLLPDALVIS